jgi:signal transduction histidine kinase
VRLPHVRYGDYPRPTFETPSMNRIDFVPLDPARFFEEADSSTGWVDEPGRPLFFWRQRSDKLVVMLTIEPRDVQAAMNGWLRDWLRSHPAPSAAAGAEVELSAPDDSPLLQGSVLRGDAEPPHWSQPLPTRYGTWNLASWDRTETRVTHHPPTLVIAATLSVIVALLGIFIFVQQRRAHRQAAQRVSFVNRVSHELRTPLTNMLLNLDVVEDSFPGEGPKSTSRLALVREEAGRLARLIENVLTFSRREQGTLKLHPAECRPREVVDAILAQVATADDPSSVSKPVTVTPPTIRTPRSSAFFASP